MPQEKPLSPIRDILESTLKSLNVETQFSVYPVWKAWKEIVGESIAKKSEPLGMTNKTLTIGVEHPAWIQELRLLTPKILAKIREEIKSVDIREIVFKVKKP